LALNISDIITVLNSKQKTHSILETIILEYGTLSQKMTHVEDQTWFFQKAEENNQLKLNDLKSQFETISTEVNSTTVDDLIKLFGW
jgi:hypothetical protein